MSYVPPDCRQDGTCRPSKLMAISGYLECRFGRGSVVDDEHSIDFGEGAHQFRVRIRPRVIRVLAVDAQLIDQTPPGQMINKLTQRNVAEHLAKSRVPLGMTGVGDLVERDTMEMVQAAPRRRAH